jgi:hypothetical protein
METIITRSEVLRFSHLEKRISPDQLNDLSSVEYYLRRKVFGVDFYDALVNDLADHSAVLEWASGQTYNAGDKAQRGGEIFKALKETTAEVTVESDWGLAEKFTEAKYEDFWLTVLGRFLAMAVVKNAAPGIITQLKAAGTIKIEGDFFNPAKEDAAIRLQRWFEAQYSKALGNLDAYLQERKEDDLFSIYLGITSGESLDTSSGTTDPNAHYPRIRFR